MQNLCSYTQYELFKAVSKKDRIFQLKIYFEKAEESKINLKIQSNMTMMSCNF